jgi:hypothetical protein
MDWDRYVPPGTYPAEDFPPYPARVLTQHVAVKGVQLGACLGLAATPLWSLLRKAPLMTTWRRACVCRVPFERRLLGAP